MVRGMATNTTTMTATTTTTTTNTTTTTTTTAGVRRKRPPKRRERNQRRNRNLDRRQTGSGPRPLRIHTPQLHRSHVPRIQRQTHRSVLQPDLRRRRPAANGAMLPRLLRQPRHLRLSRNRLRMPRGIASLGGALRRSARDFERRYRDGCGQRGDGAPSVFHRDGGAVVVRYPRALLHGVSSGLLHHVFSRSGGREALSNGAAAQRRSRFSVCRHRKHRYRAQAMEIPLRTCLATRQTLPRERSHRVLASGRGSGTLSGR
mmetsp:Transcript_30016/g.63183  ORF Transcript_30016/g.63183 Transcript_30016/m.63183 type:complete len:260 (-) Transcript_30016:721-1500(-)